MKIVHCATFNESKNGTMFYSVDRKLSNGLIRNGHFVYDFSYREIARCSNVFKSKKFGIKEVNRSLLETVKNIEPHLLLLGHSELITNDTLFKIREKFPNIKIAMWWVDPFKNYSHIPKRMEILDYFFATTGQSKLSKIFSGYENKLLFFPNPCNPIIENKKAYKNKNCQYDIVYIGRSDKNRDNFINNIKKINNIKFGLFGQDRNNLIYGANFFKVLFNSKIGLNYSRYNDIELYSSDRIVQLTANGIMTMSPKIPKYDKLFNENEIIYFEDFNDFQERLEYYLQNQDERIKVAKRGREKAHNSYNCKRISKFILETIFEKKYSENYEWINI